MSGKVRNSNLELYRIIVMLLIVAHHYVVNSGLLTVMEQAPLSAESLSLYWFGMWGKIGINCFVLITGYFMCTSSITVRKFLKLLIEVYLYKIVISAIFCMSGYEEYTWKEVIKVLLPVTSVAHNFVGCFLLFYLCIPFLNVLIRNLTKRQHLLLIALCLFIYTLLGSVPKMHVLMNYVSWFCILYFISSFIRIYGMFPSVKNRYWGYLTLCAIFVSMSSVILMIWGG